MTYIFQTRILGDTDNHWHVFKVKPADKKQTSPTYAERICRYVLKKDVPVDVREEYIV
jgi:hypothetical protein